jgi:hypothetical protein
MRNLRVEVTDGEVVLESVSVLADTEDLVVIYVDTRSKYPQLSCVSDREVLINASEHSLRTDPEKRGEFTRVRLLGLRGRWQQAFDVGRYHVTWTLYKVGRSSRMLWDNEG